MTHAGVYSYRHQLTSTVCARTSFNFISLLLSVVYLWKTRQLVLLLKVWLNSKLSLKIHLTCPELDHVHDVSHERQPSGVLGCEENLTQTSFFIRTAEEI